MPSSCASLLASTLRCVRCRALGAAGSIGVPHLGIAPSQQGFQGNVLGVGVNLEYYPGGEGVHDELAYIETTLDLLGVAAFMELGVRRSVWKLPFTHWLPLYIHPSHGERAEFREQLQFRLAQICHPRQHTFAPDFCLTVFLKLMNTMVRCQY